VNLDGVPPVLQVLLSANAHGRVIKAIIETLGDGAIDEFANALRLVDGRLRQSQELRTIEAIASESIGELKTKHAGNERKKRERIVRLIVRRDARSILEIKAAQERNGMWRAGLAAAALDIIRAHGAVDVFESWLEQSRARTEAGRARAATKVSKKNAKRNAIIMTAADKNSSKTQRKSAEVASIQANLKGFSNVTPTVARRVIQRSKTANKPL